jgi:chromosome segregation protein
VFVLYLKSLEIQGFKSFPDKTRLTFEKPITGVVGPNGSGKSNISDAILWVMGEQSSRTLRGGKMEDVIFGGTQRRTQVGFAEVSLILDNSEGRIGLEDSEVMLTRRYYRSGESEYYINRSLVRLKDISELLMDTGLGREGYSIIGQGRIAEILSTKSKDRRDIFEEAAGISRYRHRKDESERKLQQTEDNLLRIGDKISELELQIDPLREQAEVAKRYLLLRDELRGFEIAVWLRELETLRTRATKAESDHAAAKQTLDSTAQELEASYERAETLSEDVRQNDVETESVRTLISEEESRHSDVDSSIAVLKSQIEGNAVQIERLSNELQSQDDRHDGVGAQISERENRLKEIGKQKESLDNQTAGLVSSLQSISGSAGESSEEIGALLKSENENQLGFGNLKAELSALASQAQELFDMENTVKQELAQATQSLATRESEQTAFLAQLSETRETVQSLQNVVSGQALRLQNRAGKAESAGEKLDRLSFELKTLQSRRNMLAEMEKDYQGYSKAVKLIMQESARGALKNIHGTVAGLIKTGDRYTAAIETALGGSMQHIIVDTEDDGKSAINLLKRRDGGRATFLPLSTVRGSVLSAKDVGGGGAGFEGIAIDLVEFDPRYADIYANLLGRVVIADNLNSAIRIARENGHRLKIVTLDGQVINAGGSMTGGSAASSAGVLSRANELQQLTGRIEALSSDHSKAERELSECIREKNAAEYELETAKAELRAAEDSLIRQESEEAHRALIVQTAKEAIGAFEIELGSLSQRMRSNAGETESARARISACETEALALRERIEEAIRGQEQLTQERDRVNTALSELRAETASLDAERDALAKAVVELSALRDEMTDSRERQLDTINGLKSRNDEIRAEIQELERASILVREEIGSLKLHLTGLNAQKLEIEAKRSSLNKDIQGKNQKLLDMERECSRLEQRKLAAQMEERQIVDKLWDNYELSRSAAVNAASPIDSLADAQRRISSLKRQISELGNPNIGAIEEFDRVNTRYEFLSSQRDDVEKAKKELTGIIDEITAHMREIFVREFAIINESFERTFKELFGGGRATLTLEDPNDVLGCGVEIHVQPPGKSLKTLTLLSGGEKSFVAIAIYFAILTVRPPPFVVMDEIEAALDDANVLRFSSHLRRMSNNTQMIVISHKRATMEEADVLYGVTMQELGVSSILKIDLEEAEKHIKAKRADD